MLGSDGKDGKVNDGNPIDGIDREGKLMLSWMSGMSKVGNCGNEGRLRDGKPGNGIDNDGKLTDTSGISNAGNEGNDGKVNEGNEGNGIDSEGNDGILQPAMIAPHFNLVDVDSAVANGGTVIGGVGGDVGVPAVADTWVCEAIILASCVSILISLLPNTAGSCASAPPNNTPPVAIVILLAAKTRFVPITCNVGPTCIMPVPLLSAIIIPLLPNVIELPS